MFAAPTAIAHEIVEQFDLAVVGRTDDPIARFMRSRPSGASAIPRWWRSPSARNDLFRSRRCPRAALRAPPAERASPAPAALHGRDRNAPTRSALRRRHQHLVASMFLNVFSHQGHQSMLL